MQVTSELFICCISDSLRFWKGNFNKTRRSRTPVVLYVKRLHIKDLILHFLMRLRFYKYSNPRQKILPHMGIGVQCVAESGVRLRFRLTDLVCHKLQIF